MTLQSLVAQRYAPPEWAVFFEVSNGTGSMARRRADAVALGIWPSRGHALIGFEFKEDRRDWLRELKQPAKADLIANHCDIWNLVIGHESIAKPEELPEPWGLLVANKDRTKLMRVKEAQPFPDRDKGTIRRTFVSAMLRKVGETTIPRVSLDKIVKDIVDAQLASTRDGRELERAKKESDRLRAILDTFKAETGIDLQHDWRGPKAIAGAVNAILSGDAHRASLERSVGDLERAAKTIRTALDGWPRPAGGTGL